MNGLQRKSGGFGMSWVGYEVLKQEDSRPEDEIPDPEEDAWCS